MKPTPSSDTRFWRIIHRAVATILIILPFHAFLSTWLGTAIGPLWLWKSWKEILIVVLAAAVIWWLIAHKQMSVVLKDRLVRIIGTYTVIVCIATLLGNAQLGAKAAGLAMDLRYIAIFGVMYLLARYAPKLRDVWLAKTPRLIIIGGIVLAILGVLQVSIVPNDFLAKFGYDKNSTIAPAVLIDANPDAPRAFATLRGPNDYGAYLIIPLVFVLAYLIKLRDKLLLGLTIVAGLAVSASRSAWLGAVAAVASIGLVMKQLSRRKLVIVSSIGIALLIGALIAAISIPSIRLAVFHSSPGDTSLTEGSTDAHWKATAGGIERVIKDPIDGCGAGCAGPASYYSDKAQISENYFVQVAETYGLVGLTVWLVLFGMVLYRLWRSKATMSSPLLASGIGLTVIGLWLHVWSDDPLSLTWWALAGIVIGFSASKSARKPLE